MGNIHSAFYLSSLRSYNIVDDWNYYFKYPLKGLSGSNFDVITFIRPRFSLRCSFFKCDFLLKKVLNFKKKY